MSKKNKLIERVLSIPSDLTWEELVSFLKVFGFYELNPGKTGGSRRKFANDKKEVITNMHKPHPGNILKEYAIKDAIAFLKEKGHFKDE